MATAQKRGFRLPWGNEPKDDQPSPGDEAGEGRHGASDATNELGSGPFGLSGSHGRSSSAVEAPDLRVGEASRDEVAAVLKRGSWPANDRRTAGPLSSATTLASLARAAAAAVTSPAAEEADADEAPADGSDDEAVSVAEPGTADPRAEIDAPAVAVETDSTPEPDGSGDAGIAGEDEIDGLTEARIEALTGPPPAREEMTMTAVDTQDPASAAIEPASSPTPAAEAIPEAASVPRRENPLVAGLVKAMRQAAATARAEVVASFRVEADARAEAIRGESTTATEELKKVAEADVAAIKEWSRTELARVREETERRITDRKTQLVEETDFEASGLQERLDHLRSTVEAFEAEMASFFENLLAEADPARLAGLAERMPAAPALDARPPSVAPARARAAAGEPNIETAAPEAAEAHEAVEAHDGLDADDAAEAEAEARLGLDNQTRIVVSGLSAVASIAAFKAAIVHAPGVTAVNVMAGTDGEVVYTVTQDGHVNFHEILQAMEDIDARVVSENGTTLTVAAREPAA
jgi:hypothetical protein